MTVRTAFWRRRQVREGGRRLEEPAPAKAGGRTQARPMPASRAMGSTAKAIVLVDSRFVGKVAPPNTVRAAPSPAPFHSARENDHERPTKQPDLDGTAQLTFLAIELGERTAPMDDQRTDSFAAREGRRAACRKPARRLGQRAYPQSRGGNQIKHIPVGREAETIAICAGAFFGGMRSVAVMGNTGLLTCTGEMATLCLRHMIPVFCIVSARGSIDDHKVYQEVQA
jgi:hypothetical protein